MSIYSKFDPEMVKNAINLGMYKSDFPGVTQEFIDDALVWFTSDEGRAYLVEALEYWKNKENEPEPEEPNPTDNKVNLKFIQTKQLNEECGFWFDSVMLRVLHTHGENTYKVGKVFMKKSHGKTGSFSANLSDVPSDATIRSAYLVMKLNSHEGIANGDREGIFEIRDGKGAVVKEVTANWINSNYQKYTNPNVVVDITDYIQQYR